MAVSTAQLAVALRLIAAESDTIPAGQSSVLDRVRTAAAAAVADYAPDAPETVADEATIRLASALFDRSGAEGRGGNPMVASGAAALLNQWRTRRAQGPTGTTPATPVVPTPGGGGVDQTARDAAAAAQATATAARDAVTTLQAAVAAVRQVPTVAGVTVGNVLTRIAQGFGWAPAPTGQAGGGVDQTARDAAAAAQRTADENSRAVTLARSEAATADRKAVAAQDAIPAKASNADVDGESDDDDFVTVAKVFRAIARRVKSASTTVRGIVLIARNEDVDGTETDTSRALDVAKAKRLIARVAGSGGRLRGVFATTNPATIQAQVAGETAGDLAVGYDTSEVVLFRFAAPPTNAFQAVVRWQRGGRTDAELETFVEGIVDAWAIQGNADGIPGPKTFDGLFKSEAQTPIPAANQTVQFDVGNADDGNETDETDAGASTFNVTAEQANESAAFLRCRYTLTRTTLTGAAPHDIELLLQTAAGVVVGKHNIKDEGSGSATFPVGDAGAHRWAVRVVTDGRYAGRVAITGTEYHSAAPLADPAVEHVAAVEVSAEAEKRQEQDAKLRTEIARVEAIKAIVNGLPAATVSRKTAIVWKTTPPYEQAVSDAFQVPATGFVQFVLGNLGATPIMRAEDCINRQMTGIYTFGRDNVGIEFDSQRRAILVAQRAAALSPLGNDIAATTTGYLMLHWSPARASGHATTELADLETRVEALEDAPAGGAPSLFATLTFARTNAKQSLAELPAAATMVGFHVSVRNRQQTIDTMGGIKWIPIAALEAGNRTGLIAFLAMAAYFPATSGDRVHIDRTAARTYDVTPRVVSTSQLPDNTTTIRVYTL